MDPAHDRLLQSRRGFLTSAASGLGAAALGSLLDADGVLGATPPHFQPRAKACIFIFLAGGTSQVELFDPKPKLFELSGQTLPASFVKNQRFAFIKPDQARIMGSRYAYRRYGRCGMEMSELLPHIGARADDIALIRSMHTDAFDHGPAEILFSTGVDLPGRPSTGAWISYGLGSASQNLPGYVVLVTGRGPVARSMAWGSGFLPTRHAGVLFRSQGEPVLNLANPPGVSVAAQRTELDALRDLNQRRYDAVRDPQIANRIAAYELAFRMQQAAPELIDLGDESADTLERYGTERDGEEARGFATNCLLARRLVERGVRFVNIFHRRWDQHSQIQKRIPETCRIVDQPIGALLADLKQRGLLDSTLVVWGTEFGRTPVTQNSPPGPDAGRDHHRYAYSVWMAGGGVRGGHVVGRSDELGWAPVEDPVHVNDFHATLLHLLGLDHLRLVHRFKGLDFRLTNQGGNVVTKLLA